MHNYRDFNCFVWFLTKFEINIGKSISKFGMSFYKHNFPDPNRVKENIKQRQCFNSINQRYLSTSKSGKTHTARIDLSNKENVKLIRTYQLIIVI